MLEQDVAYDIEQNANTVDFDEDNIIDVEPTDTATSSQRSYRHSCRARRADMRVISQDGTLDMPYEEVIIQRFKSRIYFLNKNLTGVESLSDDMQIAEYSTESKAIKAMEMLREHNEGVIFSQNNNKYRKRYYVRK
mgnify:CR=1 FL=1